jgi:hypothetical protein
MQQLRASILPERWNIIRSLEVCWEWEGIVPIARTHYSFKQDSSERHRWERGCRTIKTLKALQRFTLVSRAPWMGRRPDAALELLEPLRDLHLRSPWELRIQGTEKGVSAVNATLKRAGFDCFVTSARSLGQNPFTYQHRVRDRTSHCSVKRRKAKC